MNINIYCVNDAKEFIILDIFDVSFKKMLIFYFYINHFRKWMIGKTNSIYSYFKYDSFNVFLENLVFLSDKIYQQILFEKPKIRSNNDFWLLYHIIIQIDYTSENISKINKFKLSFIKFVCTKLLKCKDFRIEENFKSK
jgi:hypothetical protein